MEPFKEEFILIKEILKDSPQGMSVTEIARALNKNKHSVGHYLGILQVSGYVQMRNYGKAKVFSLASRVPLDPMFGYTEDMIVVLDQDKRIVRINDPFLTFIQKSRTEILGNSFSSLNVTGSAVEEIIENIRVSLKNGIFDQEVEIKNPALQFFRQKIRPAVFDDGKQGMIIILEDITAKKSAETALRLSEEKFRLMAENLQDGIIIYEDGSVIYANSRTEEIIGYSHDELLTIKPPDLAAPEERERIQKVIDECLISRNVPSDIRFWIVRKDGTRRYIYNRITSIEHENSVLRYIIITDITEWKHVQDALEDQLGFLQHLIDTLPSPIFYMDIYGRYMGCNLSFSQFIGKRFSEIAGKTCDEILDPDDALIFTSHNHELLKNSGTLTYSGPISLPGRTRHTITIQKSTFSTKEGVAAGIVGLILSNRED
ncbi:MAG: PAS domain S-box protein [Bacteroidales bacterium]|jgi:PAS domain S-box-containing protein